VLKLQGGPNPLVLQQVPLDANKMGLQGRLAETWSSLFYFICNSSLLLCITIFTYYIAQDHLCLNYWCLLKTFMFTRH